MQEKNDSNLALKANTVFFINHFIEHIGEEVLTLCLKKSAKKKTFENPVLSLFVAEMLQQLNQKSLSLESKNTTEFNRLIYLSYIKSYFLPIAHELASSYEEQLGLLPPSRRGVNRFARYIAECSIVILRKTDKIETSFILEQYPLDKTSLKSFFVAAAVTKQVKPHHQTQITLISGHKISIPKFMSAMGVRHQVKFRSEEGEIRYQYYIPAKKKVEDLTSGYRNSIYNEIIDETVFSPVKVEKGLTSSIIFATLEDVKGYLKGLAHGERKFHNFDLGLFSDYMSFVYSIEKENITVCCTQLDFSGFDMSMAVNFDRVIFNRCTFNKANLTNASFNGCAIFDCQFQYTLLNGTQFNKAKLNFIDLSQATFETGNSFANSLMQFANLEGLPLHNADFNCADLTGSNRIEADFSGANTTSLSSNGSISVSTYMVEQQLPQEMISMEHLAFQPYLVAQISMCRDIASLMGVLFSNESVSGHDNLTRIDSSMLSLLAYGAYATGESSQLLNVSLYSGDKSNRKNAASFFSDALNAIERIDIGFQSNSIDKPLNMEHEQFIAGISNTKTELIDEYAALLAQEIFSYDRVNFTALKFYELMQEALNAKEKKPSPNFIALRTFSERLYYRVYQEILGASSDDSSRLKVFQLYLSTAIKLCNAPYSDLHSAFGIIQGLSRHSLERLGLSDEDNKVLNVLLSYISPFGNFHNLRQLVSKQCIPFLPIITRDILMSMDENGIKSYLEQMLALGGIQQELLMQQIQINEIKEISPQTHPLSDFIPTTNKLNSEKVQSFLNGEDVDHAVSSNETKIECTPRKSSTRNKRRLSTRELSRFFVRKEEHSKEEPSNDAQVNRGDVEAGPSPDPDKLSGGATL